MISRVSLAGLVMQVSLLLAAEGKPASSFLFEGKADPGGGGGFSPVSTTVQRGGTGEKRLNLSGVFHLDYLNSRSISRFDDSPRIESRSPELNWGLDLSLRTYILDPRFITLTFEPSFMRGTGRSDELETRRGTNGRNFYLDFLPNSSYPFRFHWTKQDTDYTQSQISSAGAARRNIGFDWMFRKPGLPPLSVSYDSSQFDYEFLQIPTSLTHLKTFSLGTRGEVRGWQTNLNYSKSGSREAFTGLESGVNLLQGNARKEVLRQSNLSVTALYQALRFASDRTGLHREVPFFNVHTELSTKHTEKLRSSLFHQFYRSGGREVTERAPASGATAGDRISETHMQLSLFNDLGSAITYQLLPEITVGGTASASFIHVGNPQLESATRFVNLGNSVNWHKKIGFLQTRAGYQRGLSDATTNFGNSRAVWFDGYNGGLSFGDKKYLLVNTDYSASRRPDVFQIGAQVSQRYLNAAAETQAARLFEIRASVGRNEWDYLNLRGRERYRTTTYSATLIHPIFSLQGSRNLSVGLRNLLLSPLEPSQLFWTLPVEELLQAPFSATFSVYTSASLGVKLFNALDTEFRYLRQRVLLPVGPNLLVNQYELFANYRLGKFTFNAGALYNVQDTEDLSVRHRGYYFFRMSRHFRIF